MQSSFTRIALSLLFVLGAATPPAMGQSNSEEAGAGAAAVSVVAWLCQPSQFDTIARQAFERLALQLRAHSPIERERMLDSAQRKYRALAIANQATDCAGTANLQLMARTWGYGDLLGVRPK